MTFSEKFNLCSCERSRTDQSGWKEISDQFCNVHCFVGTIYLRTLST